LAVHIRQIENSGAAPHTIEFTSSMHNFGRYFDGSG
jgi:hypothetical protein